MPTALLHVENVDDEAAAERLEVALRGLRGVHGVVASGRDGCVEVDFEDDEVSIADIAAASARAGFPARLAG